MCSTTRQMLSRLFVHCESTGSILRGADPVANKERFNDLPKNAIEVRTREKMATLIRRGDAGLPPLHGPRRFRWIAHQ